MSIPGILSVIRPVIPYQPRLPRKSGMKESGTQLPNT